MVYYIAGPMRGYDRYNFPAFDSAARSVWIFGHDVISPAELAREMGFDENKSLEENGFDLPLAMFQSFEAIKKCDAVRMLEGWEASSGACAEWCYALSLGKTIEYEQGLC